MQPYPKTGVVILLAIVAGLWMSPVAITAGDTGGIPAVTITDRTGEVWDITQAVSIGFDPGGFQFGIGRDAIQPLDATSLDRDTRTLDARVRVIGVRNGPHQHAYVVSKLTRHEIANTHLGETPIAAAY